VLKLKEIDKNSIELSGLNFQDSPDFADAFIQSAAYKDGTELSEDELDVLNSNHADFVYDCILDRVY
jgi:gamma-glutamylcysteine synthetase